MSSYLGYWHGSTPATCTPCDQHACTNQHPASSSGKDTACQTVFAVHSVGSQDINAWLPAASLFLQAGCAMTWAMAHMPSACAHLLALTATMATHAPQPPSAWATASGQHHLACACHMAAAAATVSGCCSVPFCLRSCMLGSVSLYLTNPLQVLGV